MSWSGITKAYCPPQKKEVKKVEIKKDDVPERDILLKNIDDEFDYFFFGKINSINIDFKSYISENAFPFFDNLSNIHRHVEYNFFDYIKHNSSNFYKLKQEVEEYNRNIIEEEEKKDTDFDFYDFDDYA